MRNLGRLLIICVCFVGCGKTSEVAPDADPVPSSMAPEDSTAKLIKISGPTEALESEPAELPPQTEYFVQVGAFKDVTNAVRLRRELKTIGYSVSLKKKYIRNKRFTLVEIGPFLSKEKALDFTAKARERVELPRNVIVNKYLK